MASPNSTAAPAPSPASAPPSAVEAVFNLPELCEKILWHLADDVEILRGAPLQEPVLDLFRVQAVNGFFAGVVSGSPKLQRLMWMRAIKARNEELVSDDDLRRQRIAALTWLFAKIGDDLSERGPVGQTNPDVDPSLPADEINNDSVALPKDSRLVWPGQAFLAANASWKHMQALSVSTGPRATFTVWIADSRKELEEEGDEENLELREGDTLEKVFDRVQQIDQERPFP